MDPDVPLVVPEVNPEAISGYLTKNIISNNLNNNDGIVNIDGLLKKSAKYKFSKIKNFHQFEPAISFNNKNLYPQGQAILP